MANAWTSLVKKVFNKNRKTNKAYKFGDALKDAKKIYRSTTETVNSLAPNVAKRASRKLKRSIRRGR
jgi:hypothetical protein